MQTRVFSRVVVVVLKRYLRRENFFGVQFDGCVSGELAGFDEFGSVIVPFNGSGDLDVVSEKESS